MVQICDEDIDKNEKKFHIKFDCSRREVLKNMNSIDIVACAGSGKTTLMCSKLDLLTEKQSSESKGIIVLSLTNVAIDQIKKKLGKSHKIFKYPNYCETIQKFVNTFILNSWYTARYKKKIEIIDNEYFVKSFINKIGPSKAKFLYKSKFSYDEIFTDGEDVFYGTKKIEEKQIGKLTEEKRNEYIQSIKRAKIELISEGILNYRDAFEIGIRYLKENNNIKNYIKNRFEIIFVDEMQDCRQWEKKFLDVCFSDIIFQRIGDPNQQIYDETCWRPSKDNVLNISDSLRNSYNIANFSENFQCIPYKINGKKENDIKVKFIVYKKENILKKKKKFVEIIKNKKLDTIKNSEFKIIGKVIKKNENGNIELVDYFEREEQNNVSNYEKIFYEILKQNKNRILKSLIDMMYYIYRRIDKNNYCKISNKQEFISKIEKYIDKQELYKRLKDTKKNVCEFSKLYIKEILVRIFNDKAYFERSYNYIIQEINSNLDKINNYNKDGINIKISTIAGAKGETHTATLVCETFYKKYDIEYVFDKYIRKKQRNDTVKNFLHNLYVAFTRPTELLCVAIRKEVYDKFKKEIDELKVEIIFI